MGLSRTAWLLALVPLACAPTVDPGPGATGSGDGQEPEDTASEDSGGELTDGEPMSALRLLFRASVDLRGVRPSLEEIGAVQADPDSVDATIVGFLEDPRFEERLVFLYDERLKTRTDTLLVGYDTDDPLTLARSTSEEPLRLLARVVADDRPYTELVTADWTMADEHLGARWPLDYPEGETGWQESHYTDLRPEAGVLATNGLWWRTGSTLGNANRGRANMVSRVFLCSDFLDRSIEFDREVGLLDEDAVRDALSSNPGCVACHAALDPLAAHLWGFYYVNQTSHLDSQDYHPERELWWEDETGVGPSYFGVPTNTLEDLGDAIAEDPRFVECAVETAFELLLQRPHALEDTDRLTGLRETLLSEELRLRPVLEEILLSDAYRDQSDDGPGTPWKITRPDLLASQLEDLTGYRFVVDGVDMLDNDTRGLRALAGGMDGTYVTVPADTLSTTTWLVAERLAQAAADHAASSDASSGPEAARLFTEIDFSETPETDPQAMEAQLELLYLRILGLEPEPSRVAEDLALWSDLYALDEDPTAAWAGVLGLMLRDPRFLFY